MIGSLAQLPVIIAAVLTAPTADAAAPVLEQGESVEAEVAGDFDGDGTSDRAYITVSDTKRELHVALAGNGSEYLPLEITPFSPATLSFADGVLVFEDMHGGTTALAAKYRYRYDTAHALMRLIGLDATHYSRTYAHDGFELSWNLLTGAVITRDMRLNRTGRAAAYDPIVERRTSRKSARLSLFETPNAEAIENLMASLRR